MSIVCFSVWALLLSALAAEEAKPAADWRIELVPSRYSTGKGAVLYATKPLDTFYIILHNTSGKDLRLWRDWCSWGYDNLRLEATLADGQVVRLSKRAKEWDKNYPDVFTVAAGKSYVLEVHLGGQLWQGVKQLPEEPFQLVVHYQIDPSKEGERRKIWIGKLRSEPLTVTLRQ
ncbi:hypothetical protein JIN77_03630 [Verrucomicrobiaceae bacterium R5-34]|nr:hypothetical protein [Verrucomicrobiaceae bacterium R5-34]